MFCVLIGVQWRVRKHENKREKEEEEHRKWKRKKRAGNQIQQLVLTSHKLTCPDSHEHISVKLLSPETTVMSPDLSNVSFSKRHSYKDNITTDMAQMVSCVQH